MWKKYFTLSCLLLNFNCFAQIKSDHSSFTKFLPGIEEQLAIEPALPKDFIADSIQNEPNVIDGVIWGKKEDIEQLKNDPKQIKSTFIIARLSTNVTQAGSNEFNGEKDFIKELEDLSYTNVVIEKLKWGEYPVLSLNATSAEDRKIYVAWVGLNETDTHKVLLLNFVYPDQQNEPTPDQLKIWETLLRQTKQR